MISKSPFRQDNCATGWAAMKKSKKKKNPKLSDEAWAAEKKQFKCNESTGYKIVGIDDSKEHYSEAEQTKEAKERGISKGKPLPPAAKEVIKDNKKSIIQN